MLDPKGRVIMISGANRGIGLAIARLLSAKGYSLSLGARDPMALGQATANFDGAEPGVEPGRVLRCRYEAEDRDLAESWVKQTLAHFERIDGLVNAAGILRAVTVEEDEEEVLEELWRVNVMGPLRLIRLALPALRRSGSGRILNLASMSGKRVPSASAGYPISKYAVVALSHATRRLAWADGVRVTALCPGYVATGMTTHVSNPPATEMTQPEDLAELAATVLALPNTATVPELLVNCREEAMF